MNSNIFIPKKIKVGYQTRNDTYTKKLAYVIYYDEKGTLRKETSWNSWRDHKIPDDDFENTPISGYVLNKKAGDCCDGWNHRMAYCRVYDPRGFEIEITIENLLYILENTNSIKGKGLEGEFVYGWSGKDLVLLPLESPDYKEISKFNEIVHEQESIRAKDLIIGATYLDKENCTCIYMGKYDYYSYGYRWMEDGIEKTSSNYKNVPDMMKRKCICQDDIIYGKYYWFAYKSEENNWYFKQLKSISKGKLIQCINNTCCSCYAEIYEKMTSNSSFSPYDKTKDEYLNIPYEEFVELANHAKGYRTGYFIGNYNGEKKGFQMIRIEDKFILRINEDNSPYSHYDDFIEAFPCNEKRMIPVTAEKIYEKLKPMYKQTYLKNGKKYRIQYEM